MPWRRNIAENFNRLSRVHKRNVTDDTDRQRHPQADERDARASSKFGLQF